MAIALKHTIMIIDDHPIIHDGLKTLLSAENDLEILDGATSSAEALKRFKHYLPDLAIVDLSLGDSDGTYLIQRLKSAYPKLRMLVYSMSEEKLFAERAANAGASGYVMKTSGSTELKNAIRAVLNNGTYFSSNIVFSRKKRKLKKHVLLDRLSNREMDVFKLIGQGLDTNEISNKLNISRNTVDTHRINIKNKLELPSGKALERLAYEVITQGKLPRK